MLTRFLRTLLSTVVAPGSGIAMLRGVISLTKGLTGSIPHRGILKESSGFFSAMKEIDLVGVSPLGSLVTSVTPDVFAINSRGMS